MPILAPYGHQGNDPERVHATVTVVVVAPTPALLREAVEHVCEAVTDLPKTIAECSDDENATPSDYTITATKEAGL